MKILKFEVLFTDIEEEGTDSYNNVLKELKINKQEDEGVWKTARISKEAFESDLFLYSVRKDYPNNTAVEFTNGSTMIVNMSPDELDTYLKIEE
jgi:hypothetical protein